MHAIVARALLIGAGLAASVVATPSTAAAARAEAVALTLAARAPARSISLEQLRGQVVMLNFWASWCGPCRQEFPLLDQIYRRYKGGGFTLIGVNVEPISADAEGFLAKTPVSFPIAFDRDSAAARLFQVDAMPSTVLLDRHGVIRWSHRGFRSGDENEYLDQIRGLLREK